VTRRSPVAGTIVGSVALAAAATFVWTASVAQAQAAPRPRPPRWQPEARADFIGARAATAHLGAGISIPASTYVRLGLVAAAGQSWSDGQGHAAGRVDGLVRFVVDPLREFRWAPYASGGVGAIYDHSDDWRAVLVGVIGIEGPASGSIIPAVEVGFGGGARVGVVLRRTMPGRR
jgi:hypothetical protein